jgi:hypothetical protein
MCRKPPNIMWSRKYVVPEICRPDDNMSARNRRKYVGPKKKISGALPPNPRAGGSAPLHPPSYPPARPAQALRHYYSCKEYNTYPKQLYAKPSKFFFGVKEVEYLSHIVSHEGVKVDRNKIKAMMDWTIPKTLKNLRGFLGLRGYYCKFVRNYRRIATPLTTLTKKDAFSWTPEATKYFEQLKEVMCTAHVLTTPDFTKTFIVECDASGNGIGYVLMQEGRPLAFESQPLKGRDLHKPIYEKEMMEILHALKKWRPYLIGRHFKVKTDHDSLKYFLEQRLSSEEQQKWVTKILGYDFEIVYKKGKQNVVADALSRKDENVEAFLCAISIIQPDWIIEARDEWKNDEKVWTLIQRLQQDSSASDTFTWKNDSLWYKDRLYLCKNSQLKQKVLLELHTSPIGGHSGFLKTYHRVKKDFF